MLRVIYVFSVQQGKWNCEGASWLIDILSFFFRHFFFSVTGAAGHNVFRICHDYVTSPSGREPLCDVWREEALWKQGKQQDQRRPLAQSSWFVDVNISAAPLWRLRTSSAAAWTAAASHFVIFVQRPHILCAFLHNSSSVCRFDPSEIETAPPAAKVTCHHRLFHGSADGLKSPGGSCKSVVAPLAPGDVSGKARWQEWTPVPRCSLCPPQAPPLTTSTAAAAAGCGGLSVKLTSENHSERST